MVTFNPLLSSVQGSNAFEEAVYFDIAQKSGLLSSKTNEEAVQKLALATGLANTASIVTFNAVRAPATVSASANLFNNLRTVQVVTDTFSNATKKVSDLPATIATQTAQAIQEQAKAVVTAPVQAGADILKFAIMAVIIYLVVFRR